MINQRISGMLKGTTVEGETPLDDISGLIPDYITTREELITAESKNILEAELKYNLNPRFKNESKFLFGVHRDMFCYVWDWAGKQRKTNLNIGVPFSEVRVEFKNLLDDLQYWETNKESLVRVATYFHHRLVKIHPFLNGNGRWARFVVNLYLKSKYNRVINWPEQEYIKNSEFRRKYIRALSNADSGNYTELSLIHKKYL